MSLWQTEHVRNCPNSERLNDALVAFLLWRLFDQLPGKGNLRDVVNLATLDIMAPGFGRGLIAAAFDYERPPAVFARIESMLEPHVHLDPDKLPLGKRGRNWSTYLNMSSYIPSCLFDWYEPAETAFFRPEYLQKANIAHWAAEKELGIIPGGIGDSHNRLQLRMF